MFGIQIDIFGLTLTVLKRKKIASMNSQ